jgi:glycosyltransferase involved in cell wall biosynthesis
MMPNVYPGQIIAGSHTALMVSPRGTLSAWSLSQRRALKHAFWLLAQARAVRVARCLHATAESEYEDIRRSGLKQPVCIIPNGIDVQPLEPVTKATPRQVLFLGRIHPKKGVDMLLHAWLQVEAACQGWELRIVGPDDGGYLPSMQRLAVTLGLERVVFAGPLYGLAKQRAYAQATLFVLPTHSENFGLTVAESLSARTPVIVTTGAPWKDVQKHGAGWWIETGVKPLADTLLEAMRLPPGELMAMGARGRTWMQREYSWSEVARQFADVYEWLASGRESPPSSVRVA